MAIDEEGNRLNVPLDPMVYLTKPKYDESGKVVALEVIYDDQVVHLEDGDQFLTIQTQVLLENFKKGD
jgi:hypothetical protein